MENDSLNKCVHQPVIRQVAELKTERTLVWDISNMDHLANILQPFDTDSVL